MRQYQLTDLTIFALILIGYDLIAFLLAPKVFGASATFIFTLTVPITLMVMMRWGWQSALFAVGDGLLLSALSAPLSWQSYLSLAVGNAAIALLLIPLKFIDKQKIAGKWYFSALFVVSAWILQVFGVTVMQAICGDNFVYALAYNAGLNGMGALALAAGIIVIIIMRRFDGIFEDQKHYLKRLDDERKERMRRDEFGDEPVEIDEEALSILRRDDKLK